ncbi:MAG: chemotaxis protein CheW [Acidobacteria bacterium]|nr:chemotaxis protein CheW [Acidobacteriota bacterium]
MEEGAARRREFLAQADELIDALFADLQALRAAPAAAGRERRALLDRLFRHAHTLKGSASLIDEADPSRANPVTDLSHELEDLLDAARSRRARLSPAALDACEDAADALSLAVASAARGETPRPTPPDLVERLRQLARGAEARAPTAGESSSEMPHRAPSADEDAGGGSSSDAAARAAARAADSLPAEIAAALVAAERARVAEAAGEGARIISVDVRFGLEELDEKFNLFSASLGESCETLATLPDATASAPGEIGFRLLCATREAADELVRRLAPFGALVRTLREPVPAGEAAGPAHAAGTLDTVRVSLAELDDLVFAAGELFDETLAVLEASRPRAAGEGEAASGRVPGVVSHEEQSARLRQKFHAFSDRVLGLRMQTLERALERGARAARGAARSSGKGVAVEISGGAARLDRAVAERIAEPLAHLARNAVAHGIETPDERSSAGKDARGRVRLSAVTEGARVRVTVSDDGRGVDLERVGRAAREQGLVAAGERVSEEQALRLIFRPGFSTAGRVSETSGRGVGLDAVEAEIERAGGEVRVRTLPGRGTSFELHLPLALALVPAVLVRAGGETYALDADQIADAGRLDPSALSAEGPRPVALWRDRRLPFARLDELLKPPRGKEARAAGEEIAFVVVVRTTAEDAARIGGADADAALTEGVSGGPGGDARAAGESCVVAVDEVLGRRDALVRSLGRHATRWRGTSGAIDLRDGSAALMLDLPRLLEVMSDES